MKRFPAFLSAFLFAFSLWVAVNLANDFQTVLHVQTDVLFPSGKTSRTPLPKTINITVKAAGWQLMQLLYAHPPVCNIDLHDMDMRNGAVILNQPTLLEHITLPVEAHVVSVQPDSLSIIMDDMIEKTVPVLPDIIIECKNGFEQVGALQTQPESLRVAGARSIVEGIHSWRTKLVDLHNVTMPVREDAPLSDSLRGLITISQETVTITADVQELADKKFEAIPIYLLNAPADAHITLQPSVTTVWLRGGSEELSHLSGQDIRATVDYYALAGKNPDSVDINISAPPQTTVLKETPAKTRWFIEVH
ncbi:MAG TPA: CdaR family protein [Candidatus Kapabacteria bacterium]|nr:CdaR family protein [Candidatus Kapabacteria bacterium]